MSEKDKSKSPYLDYKALNAWTIPDRYPNCHILDFSYALYGCAIFNIIDRAKAFTQIPVAPDNIPKTVITTPFGLFEFVFMTFGLRNAVQNLATFYWQRSTPLCFGYFDNILVFSDNKNEHN